jgi:hypothetical protein
MCCHDRIAAAAPCYGGQRSAPAERPDGRCPTRRLSMAEKTNILRWLPRLSQKQWQESGLHPLSDRQRAIETMLEADLYCASSMCAGRGRSVYAIIADILQGPPYTPPVDQPD